MIKITILGTGSMTPTRKRNTSGTFLQYEGTGILFDCGEGIQRQMKKAGISITKINKILLTHWHGDHVLGLPGILQSISAGGIKKGIEICSPKKTLEKIKLFFEVIEKPLRMKINCRDVSEGIFYENEHYELECLALSHGTQCNGYSFIEKEKRKIMINVIKKLGLPKGPLLGRLQKGEDITFRDKKITAKETTKIVPGRKITYITDTRKVENCVKLAKNADLLICESTYTHDLKEKAKEYAHMTAKEAAEIAKKAGVKKLVLTHISPRYKNTGKMLKEAKEIFKKTEVAEDFMEIEV